MLTYTDTAFAIVKCWIDFSTSHVYNIVPDFSHRSPIYHLPTNQPAKYLFFSDENSLIVQLIHNFHF